MSITDPLFDETDLDVPEYYCRHGVFTGNPYGADYMCGWCETGDEPPTQADLDRVTLSRAEESFDRALAHMLRDEAVGRVTRQSVLFLLAILDEVICTPLVEGAWSRQLT